jgi:hypothetical protein
MTNDMGMDLYDTPNIDLSCLPDLSTLSICGELNSIPENFPRARYLIISPAVFNHVYDKVNPVVLRLDTQYTDDNAIKTVSLEATQHVLDRLIKRNLIVYSFSYYPDEYSSLLRMIDKMYNPTSVNDVITINNIDRFIQIMICECPKYIRPVTSIKFNPMFSLYESIIVAALPDFYTCIVRCKKSNPQLMAVFFDKMRDVMRQQ